jgi:3-dehydroshikimate dehydratase
VVCQTPGVPAGCHEAPQFGLAPPRLVSAKAAGGKRGDHGLGGGAGQTSLVIEIFANPPGGAEGERYLGAIKAATDAAGKAAFAGEVAGAPRGLRSPPP